MGSSGDAVDQGFDVLKDQYEEKYPGREVEIIIQEDDVYQTTGPRHTALQPRGPDAYFEWSGPRMRGHVSDGDGADLSEALDGDAVRRPLRRERLQQHGRRRIGHLHGAVDR